MKNKFLERSIIVAMFVVISIIAIYVQYRKLSSLNIFCIGQIYDAQRKPKRLIYRFRLDGNTFEGNIQKLTVKFDNTKYYLVAYNRKDPSVNYLFLNHSVDSNYNIDSLNKCCHPSDIIEWTDYL